MEDRKNHGLVYYEKPYGKLTFGDKIITPQAGQIVYFPQGTSYDVSTEGAAETDGCHAINFLAPDLPAQEPFVFCPKAPQQIFPFFLRAEKAWKEKRPGYEEQCLSCLYAVIASLKSSSSYAPSGYGKLLFPAVEYIHENYTEKKLYGAELAALCGISETYFRRLFTGTYGVTPVEYANALKIGRAKDLLSERGDAKTKNREAYTIGEIVVYRCTEFSARSRSFAAFPTYTIFRGFSKNLRAIPRTAGEKDNRTTSDPPLSRRFFAAFTAAAY